MAPPVYATYVQYVDVTGDEATPEATVTARLPAASLIVDEMLTGAVYDTDAAEKPTDTGVADALMRATCHQAGWMRGPADPASPDLLLASKTVGAVSWTRATGGAGAGNPKYAPMAVTVLRVAGLLPTYAVEL
jgi:hypothetical protein